MPTSEALMAFEAVSQPLHHYRVALAAERRSLAAMRDALLPELMSGRLQVKDAETTVEEVL